MPLFYTKLVALLCPEERVGEEKKERWIKLILSDSSEENGQIRTAHLEDLIDAGFKAYNLPLEIGCEEVINYKNAANIELIFNHLGIKDLKN